MTVERHLLLVDDEPNVLSSLQRCLRREGYVIHLANSGAEALEHLQAHPISVVVSDQRMPSMTGSELLARVKEKWPHTLRIMLSGYSEVQSLVETINAGAAWKFLFKPWEDDSLRARIREAFDLAENDVLMRKLTEELQDANQELSRLNDIVVNGYEAQVADLQLQLQLLQDLLDLQQQPVFIVQNNQLRDANKAAMAILPTAWRNLPLADVFAGQTPESKGWAKLLLPNCSDYGAYLLSEVSR